MLVAALYDIHGNIHALDAVLEELRGIPVDLVVVGGDVAAGPFPVETLERLMDLAPTARFVRGNADRSLIEASASEEPLDANDTWALASVWCARRLRNHHLDFLAGFEPVVELDVPPTGLLFCHGSPDSDEDIITEATPEGEVMDGFQAVTVGTVVCGHTHMQFDRMVNSIRLVNAGSVGMPYEAAPGAYWALIGEEIELRRTAYDLDAAASAIRATDWPLAEEFALENVLTVPHPHDVVPQFEAQREARRC